VKTVAYFYYNAIIIHYEHKEFQLQIRLWLSSVLLLAGLIAACIAPSQSTQVNITETLNHLTTEMVITTLENPAALAPERIPPGINPLTGQPVADPNTLNRRPIVVKISNAPPLVRPQAGIGAADLVFEHYVEGGLTRFSAIFYGQAPDRVGSIRSARLIDLELVPMFGGLLAFSGASIGVEDRLNTSDFAARLYKGVLYGLPYYWRDETIEVPHNMFMNPNALWELAAAEGKNQRPDLHGLSFAPDAPPGSQYPAAKVDIRFRATRVIWNYDAELGLYRRAADGLGHFDATTLQQVTAANVVVVFADHQLTDIVESQFEDSVSYSVDINLMGEGDAFLFRDGKRYDARWVRAAREDIIGLRTRAGPLLDLKPGNTWFEVVRLPGQRIPEEEWLRVE
jgi:Protein of unknown function (DUF3048) N-terminal domain/Protein of unknown function (DUF3048) C-terminal domain